MRGKALIGVTLLVLVGVAAVLMSSDGTGRSGVEVGDRVPTYSTRSLSGEEVAFEDHRGDVVLINVWATWCAPCKVEMPSIQALYDGYRDRGFQVLAIAIDAGPNAESKIREFVDEHDLDFRVLLDPESRITRLLRTHGVPETLVLDREGRIAKRIIGMADWNSDANRALIEELLES